MDLFSIEGNHQRLDGGSMFGNCPRAVWERWCPTDEQHRIRLACRGLLVREDRGRTILFETGIGAFFPPKLRERYGVESAEHVLLASLQQRDLGPEDIDVIVLSHLHFDHAGGLLNAYKEGADLSLAFPKARFVVGAEGWHRANNPHFRDRASFIPELQGLLENSGRLTIVPKNNTTCDLLGDNYEFLYANGHTPGLMISRINSPRGPVYFLADLIPASPWVHLPITMGYDRYPELLIEEKQTTLDRIVRENGWAYFTHDPDMAICQIDIDPKGRYRPKNGVAILE